MKHIVKGLSYRGRTLIVNKLYASNLFWQDLHWIPAMFLYLPIIEGGQGLICIKSRLFEFRFEFIRSFVDNVHLHPCFTLTRYFLKNVHKLNYDIQLLQLNVSLLTLRSDRLPLFYRNLLHILLLKLIYLLHFTVFFRTSVINRCFITIYPPITTTFLFKIFVKHV